MCQSLLIAANLAVTEGILNEYKRKCRNNKSSASRGTISKTPKRRKCDSNIGLGVADIVLLIEKRDRSVYFVCKFWLLTAYIKDES
jgi:hypothetical protein